MLPYSELFWSHAPLATISVAFESVALTEELLQLAESILSDMVVILSRTAWEWWVWKTFVGNCGQVFALAQSGAAKK